MNKLGWHVGDRSVTPNKEPQRIISADVFPPAYAIPPAEAAAEQPVIVRAEAKTAPGMVRTVGPGVGELATIREAVGVAEAGDRIVVRPGTYLELLIVTQPISIEADGQLGDVKIQSEDDAIVNRLAAGGALRRLEVQHLCARGQGERVCVAIDGGKLEIDDCSIRGEANYGVRCRNRGYLWSHDIMLHKISTTVKFEERTNGLLERNDITGIGGMMIMPDTNVTVRATKINESGAFALLIYGPRDLLVEGNQFHPDVLVNKNGQAVIRSNEFRVSSIWCHEGSFPLIEKNVIFGGHKASIHIKQQANPTIRGNQIEGGQVLTDLGGAICVYDNGRGVIEDNDLFECRGPALMVSGGGNPVVRNNRITQNNGYGIYVLSGCQGTYENNDIFANTTNSTVFVDGASSVVFRHNKIHDHDGTGFAIFDGAKALLEGNEILNNKNIGIAVVNGSNATPRKNRVSGSEHMGVAVAGGSSAVAIDNDLRGNGEGLSIADDSKRLVTKAGNRL